MKIKTELLKSHITDFINDRIQDFEIDADRIADSIAIRILAEIQRVVKDEKYSDFEVVERIVCLFEQYGISAGERHDF